MRRIAFIGTGGTLSWLGEDSLDVLDFGRLDAAPIAARVPEAQPRRRGALDGARVRASGSIGADNLGAWTAWVLLAPALTRTREPDEIRHLFATH